jgi:uncharacterized protein HemX
MLWLNLKAKLALAGAAIIAVLGFFLRMSMLKNQNERLKVKAETLEAQAHQAKTIKKEEKKIKEEFRSRETDLLNELEEHSEIKEKLDKEEDPVKKEEIKHEFQGIDNLSNPNDW